MLDEPAAEQGFVACTLHFSRFAIILQNAREIGETFIKNLAIKQTSLFAAHVAIYVYSWLGIVAHLVCDSIE